MLVLCVKEETTVLRTFMSTGIMYHFDKATFMSTWEDYKSLLIELHDITDILLKVVLNIITRPPPLKKCMENSQFYDTG